MAHLSQKLLSGVRVLLYLLAVLASAVLVVDVAAPWLTSQVLRPFREALNALPEVELNVVFYVVLQLFTLAGLVLFLRFFQAKWADLGIGRMRRWYILLLTPLLLVGYMITTLVVSLLLTALIPGFNGTEKQEIGISPGGPHNLLLLALFLCILVPLAEEFAFRGYIFGLLRKKISFFATTIIVSLVFAAMHLLFDTATGGLAVKQFNVALDVFVLSLFLAYLRERTNSIWAGVVLHGLKNFVAFLLLFVYQIT